MLSPGDKVKDCEVIAPLGSGGMARLYLARRRGVGGFSRLVTLKLVHPHLIEDENIVKLFLDEARISAHVAHPNVVRVEEVGKFGDSYFIAMEYVHGVSLAELLTRLNDRRLRLRPKLCVWIAAQIAEALHAAHEAKGENGVPLGIVHRDVSPQNVLIGHTGHVKLIDFGIARIQTESDHRFGGRAVLGKLRYMSPEQLRLEQADRRTDVYALGVMLWEMLAGRNLLRCQRLDDESDWETRENPPPPSKYSAHSTPSLDRVVLKAIAYEPNERYETAFQFRTALLRADPAAVTLDAPMVAALMRSMLGDELDRRRASWPSEVSGELDDKNEASQNYNIEELTAENLGMYPMLDLEDFARAERAAERTEDVEAHDAADSASDDASDSDEYAADSSESEANESDSEGVSEEDDEYPDLHDEDAEPTVAIRSLRPLFAKLDPALPMIASSYADLTLAAATTTSLTEPMIASVRADLMLALSTASVSYDPREGLRVENSMVVLPSRGMTQPRERSVLDMPMIDADASLVPETAIDTLECPPIPALPSFELPANTFGFRAGTIGSACLVLGVFLGTLLSRSPLPEKTSRAAVGRTEHEAPRDTFAMATPQPSAAKEPTSAARGSLEAVAPPAPSPALQDCAPGSRLDTKVLTGVHRDSLSENAECDPRPDLDAARARSAARREARSYASRHNVVRSTRHANPSTGSNKRGTSRKSKWLARTAD
jgi:serine/threonine protein kinase